MKKCVSLRVLDISDCKLSFNFSEFQSVLVDYIKMFQKIQYLAIKNNPVADIPELRFYIIRELPELKVLDWIHVTKEVFVLQYPPNNERSGLNLRMKLWKPAYRYSPRYRIS